MTQHKSERSPIHAALPGPWVWLVGIAFWAVVFFLGWLFWPSG